MDSIGKDFIDKTRLPTHHRSDQDRGVPQPPLVQPPEDSIDIIDLPDPEKVGAPAWDLRAAIELRRTVRSYTSAALTLDELSYLLWCTQGVREVTGQPVLLRTVPSAGARHALETYLLINRVEGIAPGLYYFLPIDHALIAVNLETGMADRIYRASLEQDQVRDSAVTLIWAAVAYRMTWRYGERGYRYLLLDAGHVCQNLYLAAGSIGCGVCAIGAFLDAELNALLRLDGVEQFALYMATVGKRR